METLNALLLSQIGRFNPADLTELYVHAGSASVIIDNRNDLKSVFPDVSQRVIDAVKDVDRFRARAEQEMEYAEKHGIELLAMNDSKYPQRLKECCDAPILLHFLGHTDLNAQYTLNIIGTRNNTSYGQDLIRSFVKDLKTLCPSAVIFSGLAYGIDINAHRAALENGLDTVGVLAHGLDDLYPRSHRETALKMIHHGGLLSEYMTHTQPMARNFVQRNRIVAGCSDATILVESANKGGGLITCSLARSYHREVFAFPGAVGAAMSEGCNHLIRRNEANLITSAHDFLEAMGWTTAHQMEQERKKGIERDCFPIFSPDEELIVNLLQKENDLSHSTLSIRSGIPIYQISSTLCSLEMKGIIKAKAGGYYHLYTL